MKYSILIETNSLQELHAMLGVFLEATRSPRQAPGVQEIISHDKGPTRQGNDLVQSCAYCGKDLTGKYQWLDMNRRFCNENHSKIWYENPAKCPISNDLPGKENIPSVSQHDHRWLLGYITRCLKDQLPYPKIIEELKFHGVEMSAAELAEYLTEIAE